MIAYNHNRCLCYYGTLNSINFALDLSIELISTDNIIVMEGYRDQVCFELMLSTTIGKNLSILIETSMDTASNYRFLILSDIIVTPTI